MTLFQKSFSQKSIASILIIVVSFLAISPILLLPRQANAMCPVSVISDAPQSSDTSIKTGWRAVTKAYETGNLGAALATAAEQVWASAQKIVTWMKNVLLNLLLHQILAQLTNDIVNWIQNGGEPRFMSMSLDDYLGQAANNAVGAFIDQYLGAGWLCEPFDLDIKLILLDVPTFQEEVRCSLKDIVDNINDFRNDFSQGGWKGWLELSKPPNDFYGATLLALAEKMTVDEIAKRELEKDMEMGQGYLSPKDCAWYNADGILVETQRDVWGTPPLPDACQPVEPVDYDTIGITQGGFQGPCYKTCKVLTPASTVNRMMNDAVGNFYRQIDAQIASIDAGPYSVYVQAIASSLVNRITQEGYDFLTDTGEPEPQSGDLGAGTEIEDISSPEQAMQDKAQAESLIDQIDLVKDYTDDFLTEQQTNLAVLELIPPAYVTASSTLGQTVTACTYCAFTIPINATCLSNFVWARNQITEIHDNTIPSFNVLIDQVENTEIPDTLSLIIDIDSSTSLIEDFNDKADDWLVVWNDAAGNTTNPDLQAAGEAMNDAKVLAITSIQTVVEIINGTYSANNFTGLNSEVQNAISNIVQASQELITDRGNADWPEAGTLYGELDAVADLEEDADDYSEECNEITG